MPSGLTLRAERALAELVAALEAALSRLLAALAPALERLRAQQPSAAFSPTGLTLRAGRALDAARARLLARLPAALPEPTPAAVGAAVAACAAAALLIGLGRWRARAAAAEAAAAEAAARSAAQQQPTEAEAAAALDASIAGARPPGAWVECRLCGLAHFERAALPAHLAGKRHRANAAGAGAAALAAAPLLKWVRAPPPRAEAAAPTASAEALAAARRPHVPVGDSVRLAGRGTLSVFSAEGEGDAAAAGGKGWTTVPGAGGAGGAGAVARLCHLEGARNVLEGVAVLAGALSPKGEASVLRLLDELTESGQRGRLRGATFANRNVVTTAAAGALAAGAGSRVLQSFQFNCAADWARGAPAPAGPRALVEPVPPALRDAARRVGARAEEALGVAGAAAAPPDAVAVFDLREGDFLAPAAASAAVERGARGFEGPTFVLCLAGGEALMLLGERVGPLAGAPAGEFAASYAHKLARRSLVCLDERCAAQFAVPRLEGAGARAVLVVLRTMGAELRAEQLARGCAREVG